MPGRSSIPVVLDTNILVSALLSPFGPSARVFDLALAGEIRLVYDDRIVAEYREVLARRRFGFALEAIADVMAFLKAEGESVIALPLPAVLPGPDDLPFLEVAAQADATLVTGNRIHFPDVVCGMVRVLAPAEFLRVWQQE